MDGTDSLELQPNPAADALYAHYLETCALLNLEPVTRDRARELVAWWSAIIRGEPPTQH